MGTTQVVGFDQLNRLAIREETRIAIKRLMKSAPDVDQLMAVHTRLDRQLQRMDAIETEQSAQATADQAAEIQALIDSLPDPEDEPTETHHPTGDLHSAPPADDEADGDEGSLTPGSPPTSGDRPIPSPAQLSRAPAQPQFRTPAGVSLGTDEDDY